jgi:hypothetical protein
LNGQLTDFKRDTNRIFLEYLDFGNELPPLDVHINLPTQEWENTVVMETAHES